MALLDDINRQLMSANTPLMGLAQGLLSASGPSTTPVNNAQALAQGLHGFQQARQQLMQEEQAKRQQQLREAMFGIEMARARASLQPAPTAAEREFESLTEGLSEEDAARARRIKLGLDPRATGSAAQTIAERGIAGQVAATEAEIAGAKEEIKLVKQLKLKPQIQEAVTSAVAGAKADADIAQEAKSNARSFLVYESAMNGLISALGGTTTGPGVGILPAITAEAQIAEGAVAAMAPILKQMFRTAGEGTFTDKDQELLLNMVPTRKDLPDARDAKIGMIDTIIRAKLGQDIQGEPAVETEEFDPSLLEFMTPEERALFDDS